MIPSELKKVFLELKKNLNRVGNTSYKERISKNFKIEGFEFEEYSYFHPRCTQEEFLGLIEESEIILDSFNKNEFLKLTTHLNLEEKCQI